MHWTGYFVSSSTSRPSRTHRSVLIYYLSTIPTLLYPELFSYDISFIIGLIASHLLEMRSFLAAVIAIERALAATCPLHFYKYRNKISNIPVFGFILSTGIACDIVLFGFCEFRLPVNQKCANVACAYPPCYQTYSTVTRIIYASTNGCLSAVLCFRLLCLSWKRTKSSMDFKKANWLSLTDGLSTLSFDLLPSLIFNSGLVNVKVSGCLITMTLIYWLQGLGPVIGAFRQFGRAVEAGVMVMLMKKEPVSTVRSNASIRINW